MEFQKRILPNLSKQLPVLGERDATEHPLVGATTVPVEPAADGGQPVDPKAKVAAVPPPEEKLEKEAVIHHPPDTERSGQSLDYTTFGLEFEMVPYPSESPLANTAHIKLAKGQAMPVKPSVREELVTDSDNVIEYVTPVLIMPIDHKISLTMQSTAHIALVRDKLAALGKNAVSQKPTTFDDLLKILNFTKWEPEVNPEIDFRNIDEKTDIPKLRDTDLSGGKVLKLLLGFDSKRTSKHKQLASGNPPDLYESMQSTISLPLDLVAHLVKKGHEAKYLPKTGAPEKTAGGKRMAGPVGGLNASPDRTDDLARKLIESQNKPSAEMESMIYLFAQKLHLVLDSPFAVMFQKKHQELKFERKEQKHGPFLIEHSLNPVAHEYNKQENEYWLSNPPKPGKDQKQKQVAVALPSLDQHNFHPAHSAIKDRLSIWTRIYMKDILLALIKIGLDRKAFGGVLGSINVKAVKREVGGPVVAPAATVAEKEKVDPVTKCREEILEEIRNMLYSLDPQDNQPERAPVHFLDFKREDPDLRQDTLRKVEFINGRPWVLVEIRDLKDETLKALIGHEKK